jgi:Rrf2 family protein
MLRISKKADYAVFLLGAIARQGAYPGGPAETSVVSAHEIARQAGLNKSVVANLLKEFAKHGILESVRGLKGGYKLVRPPQQVTLGQILEVVEGRFTLVDCIDGHASGHSGHSEHSGHSHAHGLASASVAGGSIAGGSVGSADCNTTPTRHGSPLLALARKQPQAAGGCSLIAFCPSKQPMRVVHERISQLFHQIRLDELCGLPQRVEHTPHLAPAASGPRP